MLSLGLLPLCSYAVLAQYARAARKNGVQSTFPFDEELSLVPRAGTTRRYDFTIASVYMSPDRLNKSVILVNGEPLGPAIHANYADTIQVQVRNGLANPEDTIFHWHGILQTGTPWYDGVATVTQCPVAPGKQMIYTFLADCYGSSFYHSLHRSVY